MSLVSFLSERANFPLLVEGVITRRDWRLRSPTPNFGFHLAFEPVQMQSFSGELQLKQFSAESGMCHGWVCAALCPPIELKFCVAELKGSRARQPS